MLNLKLSSINETSAKLTWSPVEGLADYLEVRCNSLDEPSSLLKQQRLETNAQSTLFTGLTPGSYYSCIVNTVRCPQGFEPKRAQSQTAGNLISK